MPKFNLTYRPAEPRDAVKICTERNNGDRNFLHRASLYSVTETENWLKNLSVASQRIIIENDNKYVGIIRVDDIDRINSCCQIGLDIFDEYKGKGISYQAYQWLLQYLFEDLNFNSVYLEVIETNVRAKHVYIKLGFEVTGRFPQRVFREGKYISSIHMTMLRNEYIEYIKSEIQKLVADSL